jgi:hypothetical protein
VAKKPKHRTAKAKPPTTPGPRISIDDALQLLLTAYRPAPAAAVRLEEALRNGAVPLWCNDKIVPLSFIRNNLHVLAVHLGEDHWRAEVAPARIGWERVSYAFEVDESALRMLLPSAPPLRRPSGPAPRGDWPALIRRELHRMGRKQVMNLRNLGVLRENLETFLKRKIGWGPRDPKALRAVIADFLLG